MRMRGIIVRRLKMWLFRLWGGTRYGQTFCSPPLIKGVGGARPPSPISDHLGSLFFFALDASPRLMVELGTGGGESTRVFLAAASVAGADLLSVDLKNRGQLDLPFKERWQFVQSDDVEFGKTGFVEWCRRHSLEPRIDLLFIDTSHMYEHTKEEIETWSPYLSDNAIVLLHDTYMGTGMYARMDGSIGFGYDNERGVIRAMGELVERRFDETSFFCDLAKGYLIMHHPHCNGLAVLKKYQQTTRQGTPADAQKPSGAG